jgi:hypothetical protein
MLVNLSFQKVGKMKSVKIKTQLNLHPSVSFTYQDLLSTFMPFAPLILGAVQE